MASIRGSQREEDPVIVAAANEQEEEQEQSPLKVAEVDGSKLRKRIFRLSGSRKHNRKSSITHPSSACSFISDVSQSTVNVNVNMNERIDRLVDSVERLVEVTEEQIQIRISNNDVTEAQSRSKLQHQIHAHSTEQGQVASNSSSLLTKNNNEEEEEDAYERNAVRLDGLEVYTVVSALTVASSIACLDTYGGEIDISKAAANAFTRILDYSFIFANVVSTLSGIHSTLTFSLATMYGRTALGLERDVSFHAFFAKTESHRARGFQSFLWSLWAFVIQCVIVITAKIVSEENIRSRCMVLMILSVCTVPIFYDTHSMINEAGFIFSSEGRINGVSLLILKKKVKEA